MTPLRFSWIVRAHWPVVAALALVGGVVAAVFAFYWNRSIEPEFEGVAPITVVKLRGEQDQAYEDRLDALAVGARTAVGDLLAADPALSVTSAPGVSSLRFTARSGDEQQAFQKAVALRDAYVADGPGDDVHEQVRTALRDLERRIGVVREQLAAASEAPVADPSAQVRRTILQAQINALHQRASTISVQLAAPESTEEDRGAMEQELERIYQLVEGFTAELEEVPEPQTSNESRLQSLVLQQQLQELETLYVTQALELLDVDGSGPVVDEAFVIERTPDRRPLRRTAATGALAGVLVALGGAVASDRLRRPLWSAEDAKDVRYLGRVNGSRPRSRRARVWYPSSHGTTRRSHVQRLRAAVEPMLAREGTTLAVCGLEGARTADVQALATDLGAAIASAGRRVMLVDACLESPSTLSEWHSNQLGLAELLIGTPPYGDERSFIKEELSRRDDLVPDLSVVAAGRLVGDPVDHLAGRRFGVFLDSASELADTVLLAAPNADDAAAQTLMRRVDLVLFAARRGRTPRSALDAAVRALDEGSARLAGLLMLEGGRRRRRRSRNGKHAE